MIGGIVLDANALMMPFQFKLNLDKELKRLLGEVPVFVPSSVLDELSRLETREAKAALALARKYRNVETSMSGDAGVIDVAQRKDAAAPGSWYCAIRVPVAACQKTIDPSPPAEARRPPCGSEATA